MIGLFLTLALILGACATKRDSLGVNCSTIASGENAMFRRAVASALPAKAKVLSIDEFTGCDSSDNGAWLYITIDANLSEESIRKGFLEAGWSPAGEKLKTCEDACEADLAKKVGGRIVGMTLSRERSQENSSENPPWKIIIDDLDGCWTANGYTCK